MTKKNKSEKPHTSANIGGQISNRVGIKLGQHFLKSQKALTKIISAAELTDKDVVLEIGPGKGVLTERLLKNAKKIIAVELDPNLIFYLKMKFEKEIEAKKLILIEGDIIKLNIETLHLKKYKVVANIPYYITGILLRKLLSSKVQPTKAVLLMQKEVAERIAVDKKESMLSLSIKAYGKPKYIGTVSAKNFTPPPRVDSAILLIENISRDFFKGINEERFFELLRGGFSSKRKMLINNLSEFGNKEKLEIALYKSGIDTGERAENVDINKWKTLLGNLN